MAAQSYGSGGGFDYTINRTMTSWQDAAVAGYFASVAKATLPPASSYAPNGRGTPDVAAMSEGFQVVNGFGVHAIAGTSASTPTFGSLVSLLNAARFQAGKPAMGSVVWQLAAA